MAQETGAAQVGQNRGVIGKTIPVEHQAQHRNAPPAQGLQAQQGVVDGAQPGPGHQHHRQRPFRHHVNLQQMAGDGHHQTPCQLHHQRFVLLVFWRPEALTLQNNSLLLGSPVGRCGMLETIGLRHNGAAGGSH